MTDDRARNAATMTDLPTGVVTFVFTDIEGSTRLLQQLGDEYVSWLADHNRILREAITSHGGVEVRPVGDALFAVFADARDAVRAVVAAQLSLRDFPWPDEAPCRVRIGMHTGEAVATGDDYIGLAVHQASRISDAGHGGQILLSEATADLARDALPPGAELCDLGEHRLRDIVEPQRLYEVTHPELPRIDAALRTLSARPNNLPAQLTSFVGRDGELTDVKSRIIGGASLVSLVGPGGCGKTRLAVEVAGQLLDDYPNGVWFIELADVSSDALVVQAVARALGIAEEQGRDLAATLTSRLHGTKTLLVVDNCEHVVAGAAEIVDRILRTCPGTQVLATSREPLGVDGETTWAVPPLSVPHNGQGSADSDAVRLFVDRAEAMNPHFELTEEDARLVGDICRRLDGIPLALELAAARVDLLSLGQIHARLDDRFKLLRRGDRTAIPRQQTLRALVDWSYDLLPDVERVLFDRLGVFAGGFTLEAAEAVASGEPVDAADPLEALAGLVRRSLVVVDQSGGDYRYRLLETMREYALEKLEGRGEASGTRARHRRWLAGLAQSTRKQDFAAAGTAIHNRLETETANIRAALTSGLADDGGICEALQICADLGYFWWLRGHTTEGESWLAAVLERADDCDPVLRGYALTMRATMACERFDLDTAIASCTEALEIAEAHDASVLKARCFTWFGAALTLRGEFAQGRAMLDRRVEVGEDVVEEPERGGWFYLLGSLYRLQGDAEAGRRYFEASVDIGRRVRAPYVLGRALPVAANNALESGDFESAKRLYAEAIGMARQTNDRVALARSLLFFAEASLDGGDAEGAEAQLREAAPIITRQIGFPALSARLELGEGRLALSRDQFEDARPHLERALDLEIELGREKGIADARTALGSLECACGNPDAGRAQLEQAAELARRVNDTRRERRALVLLDDLQRST